MLGGWHNTSGRSKQRIKTPDIRLLDSPAEIAYFPHIHRASTLLIIRRPSSSS
jgi:hypothetical protein